jgi:hypothetical protein
MLCISSILIQRVINLQHGTMILRQGNPRQQKEYQLANRGYILATNSSESQCKFRPGGIGRCEICTDYTSGDQDSECLRWLIHYLCRYCWLPPCGFLYVVPMPDMDGRLSHMLSLSLERALRDSSGFFMWIFHANLNCRLNSHKPSSHQHDFRLTFSLASRQQRRWPSATKSSSNERQHQREQPRVFVFDRVPSRKTDR